MMEGKMIIPVKYKLIIIWLIVFTIIISSMLFFVIKTTGHTVSNSISFDNFTSNETRYYNSEGKIYISNVIYPDSIYQNQKFEINIKINNDNTTNQMLYVECLIKLPNGSFINENAIGLEEYYNISIASNNSLNISFDCKSIDNYMVLSGPGPNIDYGLSDFRIIIEGQYGDPYFSDVNFQITVKSNSSIMLASIFISMIGVISGIISTYIIYRKSKR